MVNRVSMGEQRLDCVEFVYKIPYHNGGYFLIFVIFVVDLAVTKFSYPRKLMPTVCESMMMGVATNFVTARPTLSSVSKQQ